MSQAAILGADNPNVYTEKNYLDELLAYQRQTTVDAYDKVGKHNAAWDEKAKAFLDAMAIRMAFSIASDVNIRTNPTVAEAEKLGTAAIDAGCDDPLVLDLYSSALNQTGKVADAAKISLDNIEALRQSAYPPNKIYGALSRAQVFVSQAKDPAEYNKFKVLVDDATVAYAVSLNGAGATRRVLAETLSQDIERFGAAQMKPFCNRLRAARADPWLVAITTARVENRIGWDLRNGAMPGDMPGNAWQTYLKQMELARQFALEAHQLQPNYPEAATLMIPITMAVGGNGNAGADDSPRSWFDRAVSAQFDFQLAYKQMFLALRPRWGGSIDALFDFAMECSATHRYDTKVPTFLDYGLVILATEFDGKLDAFRRPGAREARRDSLLGMANAAKTPELSDFYLSKLAGMAWRLEFYDDAKQAVDLMKDPMGVQPRAGMSYYGASAAQVIAAMNALAGNEREPFRAAEMIARGNGKGTGGNAKAAALSYRAVLSTLAPDDPARPFVESRIAELQLLSDVQDGKSVSLMPDEKLAGWYVNSGKWTSDGKTLVASTGEKSGTQLVFGSILPRRVEVQAKFDVEGLDTLPPNADPRIDFWLSINIGGSSFFEIAPLKSKATHVREPSPSESRAIKWKEHNEITIRMYDGRSQIWFNGEPVFQVDQADTDDPLFREGGMFGIGSQFRRDGITIRFTELRMAPLNQPWPSGN